MNPRRRIGLIMPAQDSTSEPDFALALGLKDYSIHGQRIWDGFDISGKARMDRMNTEIDTAAKYLTQAEVDAVAYCCTTGSFYRGPGWDVEIIEKLEAASGVPAVATTPSVAAALSHIGARKISVVTPYPQWNNDRLREYFTAKGFEVLNVDTPADASVFGFNMCNHDPETVLEFGVERCLPEADTLLVSCTGWRSLEVVEELEARTGKMVVTANQASIWCLLNKMGWDASISGCGELLANRTPAAVG